MAWVARSLRVLLGLAVVAALMLSTAASALAQAKRVDSDPTQWRTALDEMAQVPQKDFFPSIDLILGGHQEQTTGLFIVRPGGDPADIRLDFFSASGLALGAGGDAQVQTADGMVRVLDVQAYQPMWDPSRDIVGRSGPDVPASFVQGTGTVLGLQVGSYDRSRPLWIKFALRFPGYEALVANKTAATFTVTRTDDPAPGACAVGDCSLREAIRAANSSAGADIITLSNTTYQLTRTTGEDGGGVNAALFGDLDINDDVTINGNGAIIEYASPPPAGCDCKIFGINQNGTANDIQVTINSVTIRNADNDAPNDGNFQDTGGGMDIFLTGTAANVQINNSTITNNAVSNGTSNAYGGGINIDSGFGTAGVFKGSVTLTNVNVTNNTADATGGGINMFSDHHNVTVTGGSISNNQTLGTGGLGANGGGVNMRPPTAARTSSTAPRSISTTPTAPVAASPWPRPARRSTRST